VRTADLMPTVASRSPMFVEAGIPDG